MLRVLILLVGFHAAIGANSSSGQVTRCPHTRTVAILLREAKLLHAEHDGDVRRDWKRSSGVPTKRLPTKPALFTTLRDLWDGPPQTPHPAVVRVIVPENGAISHGSGTLVDVNDTYGLVVTNWHVVRDAADDVRVVFPDEFQSPARVLKVDQDWDLAALAIWRPHAAPVSLATEAAHPGDVLTIAGYGSGNYRAATGRCTQYVAPGTQLPFEMVEVSVAARQGDSGGPIMNQHGELAGVLFGSGRGSTSGSYSGRVRSFLASVSPTFQDGEHPKGRRESSPNRIAETPKTGPTNSLALVQSSGWRAMADPSETLARRQPNPTRATPDQYDQRSAEPGSSAFPVRRATEVPRRHSSPGSARSKIARVQPDLTQLPSARRPRSAESGIAGTETYPQHVTLNDLAGQTPWEQTKAFFAVVGLFALLNQLVRVTSH